MQEVEFDMYCHNVKCGLHGLIQTRLGALQEGEQSGEAYYECCDECEDLMYYYPFDASIHLE